MEKVLKDIKNAVNDVKDGQAEILIRLESVKKDIDTVKKVNSVIQTKLGGTTLGASLSNGGGHAAARCLGLSYSTQQQASASAASGTAGNNPPGNTVSKGDPFASVQDEYQSIKDKVASVKILQELRVGNSRAGIKREDTTTANIIANSA